MFSIADNLKNVSQRIQKSTKAAGRLVDEITLLPVSKTQQAETLLEAYRAGVFRFGENYLQEALEKQQALLALLGPSEFERLEWHFIGPIQSNKTKPIASHFDWVHSVDRLKIAQRLSAQRDPDDAELKVCIQVNINDVESKSGVTLAVLPDLAEKIVSLPNLSLRGLMAIPKADQPDAELRRCFGLMHQAFNELKSRYGTVDTLSMGMSGDLEAAIECGSTMVRIGTALFGARMP